MDFFHRIFFLYAGLKNTTQKEKAHTRLICLQAHAAMVTVNQECNSQLFQCSPKIVNRESISVLQNDDYILRKSLPEIGMALSVPTNALIITAEGLFVNYNDELFDVSCLQRDGDMWQVTVGLKCRNGHPCICWYCRGCAESCPYRCPGDCREFTTE